MQLTKLSLINFRNHIHLNLDFFQNQVVIIGSNGAGKTNIIEAIYILATGDTFRDAKAEEMVAFEAEVGHIGGKLLETNYKQDSKETANQQVSIEDSPQLELHVTLTRGFWQGKRVAKKKYQVNGVNRSKSRFVGHLQAVCFRPEDLRIIEGSPARRRKFLDGILSQIDRQYLIALAVYGKALRQRNKLLEMIREQKTHPRALEYWDDQIIKHGSYINRKRAELVAAFNELNQPQATSYKLQDFTYEMVYDHSMMSRERLDRYRQQELAAGHTLVGPHRDDFVIKSQVTSDKKQDKLDLSTYGSRGQQRMGVLWLKLQALAFMELMTKQRPILLLDDIFSELDHQHRQLVFELMRQQQTIATTADKHYIEGLEATKLINLTD